MNGGLNLPRGRTTDALVAFTVFVALLCAFPIGLAERAVAFVFTPGVFLAVVQSDPARALLSPPVSQFVPNGLIGAALDALFLLIAGRYVERAIGPGGIVALFVAGAYGGALGRLVLTPLSLTPGIGAQGSLFAIVGAYLMLYNMPRVIPVTHHQGKLKQIGALALFWALLQIAFMLASGAFDLSRGIVEPLGGLLAGLGLARPLLAWRYRKA